ncbi:biotin/lipoyl-containing protein [Yinghuangia aomiensis]
MPGTVTVVKAAVGDRVTAGQAVVVVEAMKMEHAVAAPFDGTVAELRVDAGAASRSTKSSRSSTRWRAAPRAHPTRRWPDERPAHGRPRAGASRHGDDPRSRPARRAAERVGDRRGRGQGRVRAAPGGRRADATIEVTSSSRPHGCPNSRTPKKCSPRYGTIRPSRPR